MQGQAPDATQHQDRADRFWIAEILAPALHLFAERGYANTTLSAIAEASGLQQSSLYYWFPKKELIFRDVLAVNRVPSSLSMNCDGTTSRRR